MSLKGCWAEMCLHPRVPAASSSALVHWLPLLFIFILPRIITSIKEDNDRYTLRCHPNYYHQPECVDHPDGYGCACGPGFYWNTRMCVASGLDSRLEFSELRPARYTLLMNKAFPDLSSFTIALWVKLHRSEHPGTVLSYAHGSRDLLSIGTGPTLRLNIHRENIVTDLRLNASHWVHLAWTWTSTDGSWRVYINGGSLVLKGRASRSDSLIPGGGEFVIGQSSRSADTLNGFDLSKAFLGDMANVNIWHHVMTRAEVKDVYQDCKMMQCGDAVEWADFRSGTRGEMKIRWPSLIYGKTPCFSEIDTGSSCDMYCSHTTGAQCNAETVENVRWTRTPADHNATVPCPGHVPSPNVNATAFAIRECFKSAEYEGSWGSPILDDCITAKQLEIKNQIARDFQREDFNKSLILEIVERLQNVTSQESYHTPIDIATVIDSLASAMRAQANALDRINVRRGPRTFGLDRDRDRRVYPAMYETQKFVMSTLRTVDSLTRERNDNGWLKTEPSGTEGDNLFQTLDSFYDVVAESLRFHVWRGDLSYDSANLSAFYGRTAFKTEMYRTEYLQEVTFPDRKDVQLQNSDSRMGTLVIPEEVLAAFNDTALTEFITITTATHTASRALPNHNVTAKSKDDNVNSALMYVRFHLNGMLPSVSRNVNASGNVTGIRIKLAYLDNFNISNPECVVLKHGNRSVKWHWSRDGCSLLSNTSKYAICECRMPGLYAVITDMYDVNWDRGEEPAILMDIPSYIGCSLSISLCLFSACLLTYFRTASKTAVIHKNFAVAIICGQLSFMLGIDRFEHQVVCQAFAIGFHYFFLATFMWLMNEAFNLYIVITYAAHSHGEHTEGGSQYRFFILGWVLPGVLVGAFVGTHLDDYYAPDMCWIDWSYIWLFLGPAIGIITVTILVLIFTAKEQHESAYQKNPKTNRMIILYSKAVWTQAILLTLSWSFAFLSIKMRGVIIKCLYAMFNGLQGAFFIVFYFLLNDEVQTVFKARMKKKTLAKQGYEYSTTSSEEHDTMSLHEIEDREPRVPEVSSTPGSSRSQNNRHTSRPRRRHRPRPDIECSSDSDEDDSDCEMIVTTV